MHICILERPNLFISPVNRGNVVTLTMFTMKINITNISFGQYDQGKNALHVPYLSCSSSNLKMEKIAFMKKSVYPVILCHHIVWLTHCGLVILYGIEHHGQHYFSSIMACRLIGTKPLLVPVPKLYADLLSIGTLLARNKLQWNVTQNTPVYILCYSFLWSENFSRHSLPYKNALENVYKTQQLPGHMPH